MSSNNPPMSGADIILRVLADEGVDTVFGYSGGAILPTYDAVFRFNESQRDTPQRRIKLVVLICGQVPRTSIGTDAFQEAPVFNIMSACAKQVFLITDPSKLEATLRAAFEIARTGRPGPVVVDIPKDVQNWVGRYQGSGGLRLRGYSERLRAIAEGSAISEAKRRKFFAYLAASKRPLLHVGGGVVSGEASDDLLAFAEYYRIPVVMTLMGLTVMPAGHPLALGMLGMHGTAYANYAVADCDFLIAVGARFDDRVAASPQAFAPKAKHVAHIDIDAVEIGKVKKADWSLVSDAASALKRLMGFGPQPYDSDNWMDEIARLKQAHAMNFNRESSAIQPQDMVEKLSRVTGGDAITTTGVGQHQMWVAQYFKFRHPRSLLTSGSMGTMGFGLPAAIGAQLARPGKLVIDIDGDGSIRMNIGDLETATTYDVPVKVLVMNNRGDGMIRQWQRLFFEQRMCVSDKSLHRKDFVLAAKADGFEFARRVERPHALEAVLREFVAFKGPAFLEVMIDEAADVYPMVGPGQTYSGMVTGEYIRPRNAPVSAQAAYEHGMPGLF